MSGYSTGQIWKQFLPSAKRIVFKVWRTSTTWNYILNIKNVLENLEESGAWFKCRFRLAFKYVWLINCYFNSLPVGWLWHNFRLTAGLVWLHTSVIGTGSSRWKPGILITRQYGSVVINLSSWKCVSIPICNGRLNMTKEQCVCPVGMFFPSFNSTIMKYI